MSRTPAMSQPTASAVDSGVLLQIISRFLDYPSEALWSNADELIHCLAGSALPEPLLGQLLAFADTKLSEPLMDAQAHYDSLFERGRSLGLWLFEHVHGESRDRGQAMVDLLNHYRDAGLEINQQELPDYIPLFLEFLATQGNSNAQSWLQEVEHILALLQARLEERDSQYAVLFATLLYLANSATRVDELRQRVAGEQRDDDLQSIDREWEEEEVTFGSDSLEKSCESARRRPSAGQQAALDVPLTWVDFNDSRGDTAATGAAQ